MKNYSCYGLLALSVFLSSHASADSHSSVARSSSTVTVRLGQSQSVFDLRIEPLKIVEDSRCPENARCVWAGRVLADVRLSRKKISEVVTLEQSAEDDGRKPPTPFQGYSIRMTGVGRKSDFTFQVYPPAP